ncbi:MAG TPA: hypothetical protein VGH11_17660 [Jatrophihabitans sp.]|jgi:hypothetical protein
MSDQVRSTAIGVLGVAVLGGGLMLTACANGSTGTPSSSVRAGGGASASSPALPTVSSGGTSGPPHGTPHDVVPASVTSVDIILTRGIDNQFPKRTLTGAAATKLAAVINALPLPKPGMVRCMADRGAYDRLTFHAGSDLIGIQVKLDPCGLVQVTRGTAVPANYNGASTINAAVLSALGLPPDA